jgi:anthranilate synthase component II
MRLVMIDNYDSFTYNLVQLFYEFDLEVLTFRHDKITIKELENLEPDWICISPGPKDPAHAGISKAVIRDLGHKIPLLGVCLGMQAINEVFDGKTIKAPVPMHGKCSMVHHTGQGVFKGLPNPFRVARYHSLCVRPQSDLLVPVAFSMDRVIMGIQHRFWPIHGVQFHPESFLSEYGLELIDNFLSLHPQWASRRPSAVKDPQDAFPRVRTSNSLTPEYLAVPERVAL